jgi:hypothetical protein
MGPFGTSAILSDYRRWGSVAAEPLTQDWIGDAMVETERSRRRPRPTVGARRFGYVIAIAINIALIVIANNLLDWGWLSFLTDDFSDLLWLLNLSFAAGIAANAVYIVDDSRRPKAWGQLVTSVISVLVSVRTLQVFPFDFSDWDTNWSWLVRALIILGVVGATVAAIVALVNLLRPATEAN